MLERIKELLAGKFAPAEFRGSEVIMRLWILFVALFAAATPALAGEASYRLNPGDVLDISVWEEEGLQREVVVLPDGMISFPLAGHLQAAGKIPAELEELLAKRLDAFVAKPVVSVSVRSVTGNKIFVIGQVNTPGEYTVSQPVTVIQALSLAGGLSPFADADSIKVLRVEGGEQSVMLFNYDDIESGKDLSSNVVLRSGDTVIVPETGLF